MMENRKLRKCHGDEGNEIYHEMRFRVFRVNACKQEENDGRGSQELLLIGPVFARIKLFPVSLAALIAVKW